MDQSDKPSTSSIAESAKNSALQNLLKRRKSYGTRIEKLSSSKEGVKIKKVFTKPKSRTQDLTNLVGYVNGKPYYGPFHIHEEMMEVLLKWLVSHTQQHLTEIIYDTVQESLNNANNTNLIR